jgi:hypothetical protein
MEITMRMMLKVSIPVESGNKSIADGTLPKTVMDFLAKFKPEAAYFVAEAGKRTGYFFFELADATDIPSVAESFFMNLNAAIELTPAMNAADMREGIEKAMKDR